MKRILLFAIMLLSIASGLRAQTAPDSAELTKLLQDFLAGAGRNDVAMHERFWADDLIYTHSSARLDTKQSLIGNMQSGSTVYTSVEPSDVKAQDCGDIEQIQIRRIFVDFGQAIVLGKKQSNRIHGGHSSLQRVTC